MEKESLRPHDRYGNGAIASIQILAPGSNEVIATIKRDPRLGVVAPNEHLYPTFDAQGRIVTIDILNGQTGEQLTTITLDPQTRARKEHVSNLPSEPMRRFQYIIDRLLR